MSMMKACRYIRDHPYVTLAHFGTFYDPSTIWQQRYYSISAKIDVFVTPPTHLPTQFFCRRDLEMVPYTDQKISLSINTMHNGWCIMGSKTVIKSHLPQAGQGKMERSVHLLRSPWLHLQKHLKMNTI